MPPLNHESGWQWVPIVAGIIIISGWLRKLAFRCWNWPQEHLEVEAALHLEPCQTDQCPARIDGRLMYKVRNSGAREATVTRVVFGNRFLSLVEAPMNITILPSESWQSFTLDISAARQYHHDPSKPYYLKLKTNTWKTFKAKLAMPQANASAK